MNRQQNTPTVQYCIEVKIPGSGEVVDRFTIEQVETGPKMGSYDHPNYNTVQRHLSWLAERNGLEYEIVAWGDVFDMTAWKSGAPLRA